MAMAALRCVLEKVGRTTGFNNHHGMRSTTTLLGFLVAANNVINNRKFNNYQQHLLSRHFSCHACMKRAQQFRASESQSGYGGIQPYPGSMEDFAVTRPALFAVEKHNKRQEIKALVEADAETKVLT